MCQSPFRFSKTTVKSQEGTQAKIDDFLGILIQIERSFYKPMDVICNIYNNNLNSVYVEIFFIYNGIWSFFLPVITGYHEMLPTKVSCQTAQDFFFLFTTATSEVFQEGS